MLCLAESLQVAERPARKHGVLLQEGSAGRLNLLYRTCLHPVNALCVSM